MTIDQDIIEVKDQDIIEVKDNMEEQNTIMRRNIDTTYFCDFPDFSDPIFKYRDSYHDKRNYYTDCVFQKDIIIDGKTFKKGEHVEEIYIDTDYSLVVYYKGKEYTSYANWR